MLTSAPTTRSARLLRRLPWAGVPLGVLAAVLAYAFLVPIAPLASRAVAPGSVVLDAQGAILARDVSEGTRIPVALDRVAPAMVDATVAAEDQRFWIHPGFDPLAMARAAVHLRSNPSGASTITQQLARRLYLRDQSLPLPLRKAREILIAIQLEARTSKADLLDAYLNDVYYGRGAYGVEAAARVYFGVSAADLDVAQAAYLAGLPQLPSRYDSAADPAPALARQVYVLDRMVATGALDRAQAQAAAVADLRAIPPQPAPVAPHFVQLVRDELQRVAPQLAGRRDLVIETTLDATLQAQAVRSVAVRLGQLASGGTDHRAGNAAVVVIDPRTGALLALVGNAHPDDPRTGDVDLALATRQPGSALKPFLYATAFEQGFTAATPVLDVPTTFQTSTGPYAPNDYDMLFRGPVPVRVALASSLNVPAVRTLDAVGVDAFLATAHRFGLNTLDASEAYGLALALGGGDVRLLDLTAAYAALADEGQKTAPYAIARVLDQRGDVLYAHPAPRPVRVLSEQDTFLLSSILSDPVAREPGFGAGSVLETAFPAAVKTGTSSDFRDNWTVGYTPSRTVGVWVGNPDGAPMVDISGVDGAGPIWRDVIDAAMQGVPAEPFTPPPGMEQVRVCSRTGLLPGPDCATTALEWFVDGTAPAQQETYYVSAQTPGSPAVAPPAAARPWSLDAGMTLARAYDTDGKPPAHAPGDTAAVSSGAGGVSAGASAGGLPAGAATGGAGGVSAGAPFVVEPADGTVIFVAPEIPNQQVWLRASVPPGARLTRFFVDGAPAGEATGDDPRALWPVARGTHVIRIEVVLADGTTAAATSRYEVK